ncbi:MAG: hypothetical protein AAGM67_18420, partial [Bacteroidota bacterium]
MHSVLITLSIEDFGIPIWVLNLNFRYDSVLTNQDKVASKHLEAHQLGLNETEAGGLEFSWTSDTRGYRYPLIAVNESELVSLQML